VGEVDTAKISPRRLTSKNESGEIRDEREKGKNSGEAVFANDREEDENHGGKEPKRGHEIQEDEKSFRKGLFGMEFFG